MAFVSAVCPECGGQLQIDNDKDVWFCGYCGTKFLVEQAINNITNYNTISADVVNIYGGTTDCVELNRMIQNIDTFMRLLEFDQAMMEWSNAIKKYPDKHQIWWKRLSLFFATVKHKKRLNIDRESFSTLYKNYENTIRLCPSIERNNYTEQWENFWQEIADMINQGEIMWDGIIGYGAGVDLQGRKLPIPQSLEKVRNQGLQNAEALTKAGLTYAEILCYKQRVEGFITRDYMLKRNQGYDHCITFAIGRAIYVHESSYDGGSWRLYSSKSLIKVDIECIHKYHQYAKELQSQIEESAKQLESSRIKDYLRRNICPNCYTSLRSTILGRKCPWCHRKY